MRKVYILVPQREHEHMRDNLGILQLFIIQIMSLFFANKMNEMVWIRINFIVSVLVMV